MKRLQWLVANFQHNLKFPLKVEQCRSAVNTLPTEQMFSCIVYHAHSQNNGLLILVRFKWLKNPLSRISGWEEKGRKSAMAKKLCRPRFLPSILWSLEDAILRGSYRALLATGETQGTARLCNSWSSWCSTYSRSWIRQRKPGRSH